MSVVYVGHIMLSVFIFRKLITIYSGVKGGTAQMNRFNSRKLNRIHLM